jgi:hypothetical protein
MNIDTGVRNRRCRCSHLKRVHFQSRSTPHAPCRECACAAFKSEPVCHFCNHGVWAHKASGGCKSGSCLTVRCSISAAAILFADEIVNGGARS